MAKNSKQIQEQIDSILNKVNELMPQCGDTPEFGKFLEDIRDEFSCHKRAFDTQRFFVVTIGALKAGKSTLINALTGYDVSPAGTGAETTKKCSVIMSADEKHPEGITLYRYLKKNSDGGTKDGGTEVTKRIREELCRKATRKLMEYFKGICEWDDLKKEDFDKKDYPLREKTIDPSGEKSNLEYIITSSDFSAIQPFDDFLLAEIRVKVDGNKESILKDNVAIIDMPGLDGTKAGVNSDESNPINFLPQFCHLFLLVHSSISGLNRTTATELRNWVSTKRRTPIYLVFNEINSKAEWHSKKDLEEETKERQKKAFEELKQQKIAPQSRFTLNAAKAWESCQENEYKDKWAGNDITAENLRKESNIEVLSGALLKDFKEQKDRIIQEDALNGVRNSINKFGQKAQEIKDRVDERLESRENERSVWHKIIACFDECNKNTNRGKIKKSLQDMWEDQKSGIETRIKKCINEAIDDGYWMVGNRSLLGKIRELASRIQDKLGEETIEEDLVSKLDEGMKGAYKLFVQNLNSAFDKIKDNNPQCEAKINEMQKHIRHATGEWQDITSELKPLFVPKTAEEYIDESKYRGIVRILNPITWFRRTKEYGEEFAGIVRAGYKKEVQARIKEKLLDKCVLSKSNTAGDNCIFNELVNSLKRNIEEWNETPNREIKEVICQCQTTQKLLPVVEEQIAKLDKDCAAFEERMS